MLTLIFVNFDWFPPVRRARFKDQARPTTNRELAESDWTDWLLDWSIFALDLRRTRRERDVTGASLHLKLKLQLKSMGPTSSTFLAPQYHRFAFCRGQLCWFVHRIVDFPTLITKNLQCKERKLIWWSPILARYRLIVTRPLFDYSKCVCGFKKVIINQK